ncbi:hypothetical protein DFH29DRAFT_880870 [Suillus ampliporus]|nr:hypothetical protein DFH29DRAFT_880870 [Suillus ampliporus]
MQAIVSNPSLGINVKCLESVHTTCADIYLYWLAIVAQMEQLLRGNTIQLQEETKLAICTIMNAQFNKMINDAPNDPYITAFVLHPDSIIKRVGTSLQLMFKHEYGDVYDRVRSDQAAAKLMKERNPHLVGLTLREALQALKVKLKEYHKGADPFNHKIHKHENT